MRKTINTYKKQKLDNIKLKHEYLHFALRYTLRSKMKNEEKIKIGVRGRENKKRKKKIGRKNKYREKTD